MIKPRPLSPHLKIYNIQQSSFSSIFNRVSGVLLGVIFALFYFVNRFIEYNLCLSVLNGISFADSFISIFLIIYFALLLSYHFASGIRHYIWDAGYNLELNSSSLWILISVFVIILITTLI